MLYFNFEKSSFIYFGKTLTNLNIYIDNLNKTIRFKYVWSMFWQTEDHKWFAYTSKQRFQFVTNKRATIRSNM